MDIPVATQQPLPSETHRRAHPGHRTYPAPDLRFAILSFLFLFVTLRSAHQERG